MMNWLFSGGKANSPTPTNLQAQKSKQIESLNKIPAQVTEMIRDVEYRVSFQVNNLNFSLIISLPPQFPQDKPQVKVDPGVHHPWVDNQMRLMHCPALLNFSMHSSLGSAIQSIVEEFRRNPPRLLSQSSYSQQGQNPHPLPPDAYPLSGYPPPGVPGVPFHPGVSLGRTPSLSSYTSQSSADEPMREESGIFYQMPDIPLTFPALQNKSMTALNELMNDEGKLLELLQQLPELETISKDREELSKTCEDLARENLCRRPTLENLKSSLIEKLDRMNALRSQLEDQIGRQSMLGEQFHPSNIQTHLKVATLEAEEESEKIAEDFLDKKFDVEEFKQKYMEIRCVCHSRRAKEEKLQQILMSHGHHGY